MYAQLTSPDEGAGVKPATRTTTAQRKDRVMLSWTLVATPPHGRRLTASWSLPNQSRRLDRPCLHRQPTTRIGGTMPEQRAQIDQLVTDQPVPALRD